MNHDTRILYILLPIMKPSINTVYSVRVSRRRLCTSCSLPTRNVSKRRQGKQSHTVASLLLLLAVFCLYCLFGVRITPKPCLIFQLSHASHDQQGNVSVYEYLGNLVQICNMYILARSLAELHIRNMAASLHMQELHSSCPIHDKAV
jgi:hypothetical protein